MGPYDSVSVMCPFSWEQALGTESFFLLLASSSLCGNYLWILVGWLRGWLLLLLAGLSSIVRYGLILNRSISSMATESNMFKGPGTQSSRTRQAYTHFNNNKHYRAPDPEGKQSVTIRLFPFQESIHSGKHPFKPSRMVNHNGFGWQARESIWIPLDSVFGVPRQSFSVLVSQ